MALGLEMYSTANPSVVGKTQGSALAADGARYGLGTTKVFSWTKAGGPGTVQRQSCRMAYGKNRHGSSGLAEESCKLGSQRYVGLLKVLPACPHDGGDVGKIY